MVCTYHILFIHSYIHLSMGNGIVSTFGYVKTLRTLVYKYLLKSLLQFFGYIPRRGIAGSYDNSMLIFLRNLHTVSFSSLAILYSHQQCTRVLISPHPHKHLLILFLITVILMSMKWCSWIFASMFIRYISL